MEKNELGTLEVLGNIDVAYNKKEKEGYYFIKDTDEFKVIKSALKKYDKYKNLIKIMEEIEKDNTIHVSKHGHYYNAYHNKYYYFEYTKEYEVGCIYHNGTTWVIRVDNLNEYDLDKYGIEWKLTSDEEISYTSLEVHELTVDEVFEYMDR